MGDMLTEFERLIGANGFPYVDRFELPAQPERSVAVPDAYARGSAGQWLMNDEKLCGRLWLHQAKALTMVAEGRNLVVSTGTASGKSLIFQSAAFRMLDEDAQAAVIAFYPLKALSNDQLMSWRRAAGMAGLREEDIVKVDGDVSRGSRAQLLEEARVVLMTPDVCHAWFLNEISNAAHQTFLARTALVVIDEAHVLEGVFGSNFAYLFRRLCLARHLVQGKGRRRGLQVIAASATISAPARHLSALTGLPFEAVGETDDGAPQYRRTVVHLSAASRGEAEVVEAMHDALVEASTDGSFITFVDSRQGAERLAVRSGDDSVVKPYRSGYEPLDRSSIEDALREGRLRGVVSTSALELGIDIPHFAVGFNLGIPVTRKSFRQRLGRVGRQRPGSFALIAEPYAFRRFGSTLREYYDKSVEPSHLYLGNRFVQFAHARCLVDELEMLGVPGRKALPRGVVWPDGFAEVFEFADPGGRAARPREFDQIHRIGGDQPHFNYPLRHVPEGAFQVVHSRFGGDTIVARLTLQQAIREAFPGATYLHMAEGWRVHEWRSTAFDRTIRVSPARSPMLPKPLIRTFVNFSIERDGIVAGHFREGSRGFLAECHLQINERVEGFRQGGQRKLYKDLRQLKPGMTPKTRDFRTTGVVMRIDEDWFREPGVKQRIADSLRHLMLREYSISPQDVDAAATNVSVIRNGQRVAVSDVVVLFDATHGTLRLTEPVYLRLSDLLVLLARSVRMTPPEDDHVSEEVVAGLSTWLGHLGPESAAPKVVGDNSGGWIQVYEVGSIVSRRGKHGVLHDIEVEGHEFIVFEDEVQLFYRYKTDQSMKAMTSAESVEAVGDEWTMVYLHCETGERRSSLDDGEC